MSRNLYATLLNKGDLKTFGIDNKEAQVAIGEYVGKIDAKDLVEDFNQSDGIPSIKGNESGTFSYLTEDSIGISVQTIFAIGGHAEFEIKYRDLADNLKPDNTTLNTFLRLQKK